MTHTPSIQPIGFHLGLSGDWQVTAVSANIGEFLDTSAEAALGQPITTLFSNETIHDIRNRMALLRGDDATEHLFQFPLAGAGQAFDLAIYRTGDGFGIDVEPCSEHSFGDATGILEGMLSRVGSTGDIEEMSNRACNQLRALTGFQQVMISAGGSALGHSLRTELTLSEADIAQASPDMVVFDRDAASVPIRVADAGCDLQRLTFPSPSSAEIAHLKSIDAKAALIVPLRRDSRPWGQAACFHDAPRHISAERRNIARLFASIISLRIEIAELRRRG